MTKAAEIACARMAEAERIYHQNLQNLHNLSKQCMEARRMVVRTENNGCTVVMGNGHAADMMGNGGPTERTRLLPTTTTDDVTQSRGSFITKFISVSSSVLDRISANNEFWPLSDQNFWPE